MNENMQVTKPSDLSVEPFSAFGSIGQFTDAQRMAKALCSSSIVPETYRGEGKLGDCVIALEISNRIGMNVLAVMQNLYQVHGRPAWSSQFLIACVNASRRFSPLRYKATGEKNTDSWGCIAWATDSTGEVLESPEVTIGMAKAEGWYNRNGSKWKTMPELMLRYRCATLFARIYAPELTMGIRTDDEVIDIGAVEVTSEPANPARKLFAAPAAAAPLEIPATAEAQAEPEPKKPTAESITKAAPVQTPQSELANIIVSAGFTFDQFRAWGIDQQHLNDSVGSFDDVPSDVAKRLIKAKVGLLSSLKSANPV